MRISNLQRQVVFDGTNCFGIPASWGRGSSTNSFVPYLFTGRSEADVRKHSFYVCTEGTTVGVWGCDFQIRISVVKPYGIVDV
jgi:hypothetical protein